MKKIILNKDLELKQMDTTPKRVYSVTKYIVAGGTGDGAI